MNFWRVLGHEDIISNDQADVAANSIAGRGCTGNEIFWGEPWQISGSCPSFVLGSSEGAGACFSRPSLGGHGE